MTTGMLKDHVTLLPWLQTENNAFRQVKFKLSIPYNSKHFYSAPFIYDIQIIYVEELYLAHSHNKILRQVKFLLLIQN